MSQNEMNGSLVLNPAFNADILPKLPRFNREFIGIGHKLEAKRKQTRQIAEEEKALANRVLYLHKEELKARKKLKNKKTQLARKVQQMDENIQHQQEKEKLRQQRQRELQAMREQNRHRRLLKKETIAYSRFQLQRTKKQDYYAVKGLVRSKEEQKRRQELEQHSKKRDRWLSLNLDKEKGRQKIDSFFKKKNQEHTKQYLSRIDQEQQIKRHKLSTIRYLEQYQAALRNQLEQSSLKVSQVEEKILRASRTLEPKTTRSPQTKKTTTPSSFHNLLLSDEQEPQDNKSFLGDSSNKKKVLTPEKVRQESRQNMQENRFENDGEKIEELIEGSGLKSAEQEIRKQGVNCPGEQGQANWGSSGFKVIRRMRRKKNPKEKYKSYLI